MSSRSNRECLRRWRLAAGLACAIAANACAADVWVFTDGQHPVGVLSGTRVVELDAPASLEAVLSARLPADSKQAAAIVRQRLEAGGAALQRRLAAAFQGVTDAWSLGVTKIPAVVVDRRYVVYGISDVNRAMSLIERYQSKRP